MHSGGGSSNSVVSVAPATPIVKNMIGVAALVLEGRDRGGGVAELSAGAPHTASKSKDRVVLASTSSSNAMYMAMDPMAVASSNTTASMTTSNWARAQNNRLAHIYRLKNRLLVDSAAVGQQQQQESNRSSPVPPGDCDDEAAVVAFGGLGVFDAMQHLTSGRTCRLTTPRSFMNLQVLEKRQTSSSSTSSAGSSAACSSSACPSVAVVTTTTSRRNSRSSPVPAMMSSYAMGTRTHCDDFLRTIGLLKGAAGSGVTVPAGAAVAVNNRAAVVEDESHYCDEVVSPECFRWQQFLRKIETLLCRGSSLCIEVSLGPETHPLLLEQWVIERVERPTLQPSMTIQSLCSAIRSQLHFSQISAWSDLLEQQYTDYGFYQEHILKNPRITMTGAGAKKNRPALNLLYRVKCATTQRRGTFERAPVVHNFPNVVLDASTGLAVSLRSLPRLERIPRLSVENKKSDMMVAEVEILPSPMVAAVTVTAAAAAVSAVCCQEKGKHRCLTYDELQQQEKRRVVDGGGGGGGGGESSSQQARRSGGSSCSSSSSSGMGVSHREKQLLKYKKRLLRRDQGGVGPGVAVGCVLEETMQKMDSSSAVTSINDLRLPPLYTEEEEKERGGDDSLTMSSSQDVATQTDLQMSVDDELVEMEVDDDDGEEEVMVEEGECPPQSEVSCSKCNKQMRLVCFSQCCDSSARRRLQRLTEKYRNAMVAKKASTRLFLKVVVPKGRQPRVKGESQEKVEEDNNNVASAVNRNVKDYYGQKRQSCEMEGEEEEDERPVTQFTSLCDYSEVERRAAESPSWLLRSKDNAEDQTSTSSKKKMATATDEPECEYHTPTNADHSKSAKSSGGGGGGPSTDASFHTMKLSKLEHEASKRPREQPLPTTNRSSSSLPNVIKSSVYCVKNLTSIFTNATEAAAAALVKPPTPQVMLKRLNLYTAAVAAQQDVFNFDLLPAKEVVVDKEAAEDEEEESSVRRLFGIKKSFSTPEAAAEGGRTTPNSLSPRFLKAASVYNKKQRRSRHLSDRSSERSSVCSDELSLSDDETLLLTPNGSSLLLTASPVLPAARRTAVGGVVGVKGLFKSAFGQRALLGSIEESLLQRRMTPKFLVSGFRVLLGASGGFCPKQLTIPAKSYFYELSGQSQTTPYMSEVRLPRKGYTVPRNGTVQVTLLNPLGTFVHMFVVAYDLTEMPPMSTTFVRQRTLMVDEGAMEEASSSSVGGLGCGGSLAMRGSKMGSEMRLLRYVIHLRFQTTRSGRLVLHSDIRMLINRRTDHDTAAAHAKGTLESPNELKTITIMPENPRFSERLDKV